MKGQIVSGNFSTLAMRIKASEQVEIGELVIIEQQGEKYLLQVIDLAYGSQISQQNLEMVAGLNLEEGNVQLLDEPFRNYQLALLKPLLILSQASATCKKLPRFFAPVREIRKDDVSFIMKPDHSLYVGSLRSGSKTIGVDIFLNGRDVVSHHILIPASTGKGKSNLLSCLLWNLLGKDYAGLLVLDPHDEYYGRTGLGLKDHPARDKVSYYTPSRPPPGAKTLKINIKHLKPEHFQGAMALSDPQRQCLFVYAKRFGEQWIYRLLAEEKIEGVKFHEDTIAVVKRKLITLLGLDLHQGQMETTGIFDMIAGEMTISEICHDLEQGKVVIVDTSYFSGALEILVGSIISSEIFERYKWYKKQGHLQAKPVVGIVLEEAPRVLGKQVLEQGSNIFETIAREGRKFQVGLIAITQLPSEIPKNILANMNTKIILGLEMATERQAVMDSSPQDLSQDNRNIAALDKGEALITSTFTRFAIPVKVPLFKNLVAMKRENEPMEYPGLS